MRDNAGAKLLKKATARRIELEAEIERLSQYGKQSRKAAATTPDTKPTMSQGKADDASSNSAADAAVADTPLAAAA